MLKKDILQIDDESNFRKLCEMNDNPKDLDRNEQIWVKWLYDRGLGLSNQQQQRLDEIYTSWASGGAV